MKTKAARFRDYPNRACEDQGSFLNDYPEVVSKTLAQLQGSVKCQVLKLIQFIEVWSFQFTN